MAESATGRVLFLASAPGGRAVASAGDNLPVFVLLPGGRILPVLTAAAGRPATVAASGEAAPDWRAPWCWSKEDPAGWLFVLDSSLAVRQMAPLAAAQFPNWKPAEGAFVLEAPLDPRSGRLAGRIAAIGGKRLA